MLSVDVGYNINEVKMITFMLLLLALPFVFLAVAMIYATLFIKDYYKLWPTYVDLSKKPWE